MTGQHVRQILQEPDRGDGANPVSCIGSEVECPIRLEPGIDRWREFVQFRGDQARAKINPDPGRVHARPVETGVHEGELGRRHGKLNVPGHVFQTFADRLAKLGDGQSFHRLVVEVSDLGADVVGQSGDREGFDLPHGALAFAQGGPEGFGPDAERRDQAPVR